MQYSYKLCLMPLEARFVPVNPSKVYEDEQLSHKNGILNEVIGKPLWDSQISNAYTCIY